MTGTILCILATIQIVIAIICYLIKRELEYTKVILDIQNEQILYLNKKIEECKDDKK